MPKIKTNWITLLFLLTTACLFFLPHTDTDFGWHYRCGKELLEGSPCIDNTFSYFLSDYKWAYPSFIYDGLLAITYNLGGFLALSVLGTIILTSIVYVIYKNIKAPEYFGIILIFFAIYFSWSTLQFGLRSQIFSILFLLITISLLFKNFVKTPPQTREIFHRASHDVKTRSSFYLIPPLFLLWANTHAGFILGPLVIGSFWFHTLYQKLTKNVKNKHLLTVTGVTATSILATLINPFGYRIYEEIYKHYKVPLNTTIAEWVPPPTIYQLIIIALLIFYIIKAYKDLTNKNLNLFSLLIISGFSYMALTARRNLPIFFLTYAMLIGYEIKNIIKIPAFKNTKLFQTLLLLCAFLFFGLNNVYKTIKTNFGLLCGPTAVRSYPCEEIKYFEGKSGNVYNTYEWGGFLIWKIPHMKIFVDGRMPAWETNEGVDSYTYWLAILQTKDGWQEKLDKYETDYLLIAPGTFLDLLLRDNPEQYGYIEELRGDLGVIYKRTTNN